MDLKSGVLPMGDIPATPILEASATAMANFYAEETYEVAGKVVSDLEPSSKVFNIMEPTGIRWLYQTCGNDSRLWGILSVIISVVHAFAAGRE